MTKKLENKEQLALRRLTHSPEWKILADVVLRLREHWKNKLLKFGGKTIEEIAIERIVNAARVEGVDMLLVEIKRIMEEEHDGREED